MYGILEDIIDIRGKKCNDPSGCICGNEDTNMGTCWVQTDPFIDNQEDNFECLYPIKPNGFCHEICGKYRRLDICLYSETMITTV